MPTTVELKHHRLSYAKRLYEILSSPAFIHTTLDRPKSVEDERNFLKKNAKDTKMNIDHGFSIFYEGKLVGCCGIKINQHRKYVGEIGYFIDEHYWGRGIATAAVRELETIGFKKLGLVRIEILIVTTNKASQKVAIKSKYKKEGVMRKALKKKDRYLDCHLYAKVL